MNAQIRTLRISIIVIFILITIGAFLSSIYWIWLTAFGVGWSGKETTLIEIIWMWKGMILISIYSLISSVGLAKKKKFGIIFGYAIAIGILTYFLIDFRAYGWNSETPISVSDFFWSILFLGIPIIILFGLTKIKKSLTEFKTSDYIKSGILTIILFLSFYFMFD